MRTLRDSLVGMSMAALLVGAGSAVIAQDDEAGGITAQALDDMVVEAWNGKDAAMLEQVYAPDAIHRAVYFDGVHEWVGREAVIEDAMLAVTVTSLGPIMELDAPHGELHWVSAADVVTPSLAGTGTVCNLWARDGQIVRHDCLLSMDCPVGMCRRPDLAEPVRCGIARRVAGRAHLDRRGTENAGQRPGRDRGQPVPRTHHPG